MISTSVSPELIKKLHHQQESMRRQIIISPPPHSIRTIAGCDSSITGDHILSVIVVLSYPGLNELEIRSGISPIPLPYIPGFLAFREAPGLVSVYHNLNQKPDILMVDGHGIMHPRRIGIATHLGLLLNLPSFGVAKKPLAGIVTPPALTPGSATPVTDQGEIIGFSLRSKRNVKPIFISPGHLCDLPTSLSLSLSTLRGFRLPEPTRLADKYSHTLKP